MTALDPNRNIRRESQLSQNLSAAMILRLLQHHANRPFKKTYCLGIILILFLRIRHTIYYTIQHNAAYVVRHSAAQHNTSIPSMTYLYAKINNNGVMTKNCMSLAKYQDQPIHYETRIRRKNLLTYYFGYNIYFLSS